MTFLLAVWKVLYHVSFRILSYKAFSFKPLTEENNTQFIYKETEEQLTEETYLGEESPHPR